MTLPDKWRWLRQLPNGITVVRVVLVAPCGWLLWQDAVLEALALVAVAGASDAVDGILARRFDWRTRFGAFADPAADKLLMLVVFGVLAAKGHVPLWLVAVVVGRDMVIISGAFAFRQLLGHVEMAPTLLSKVNTAAQIVLLVVVLVGLTGVAPLAGIAAAALPAGFYAVAVTGVVSGAHYVFAWSHRARVEYVARQQAAEVP